MRKDKKGKKRIGFLGFPIDALTMEETLAEIERIIEGRKPVQHCVVNAAKIVYMKQNSRLARVVSNCGMISADGQPVVWASRFFGERLPERVNGTELMENLVKLAAEKSYPVYFLGARKEVVKKLIEVYNNRYPALKISGFRNGYFTKDEESEVVEQIRSSHADILFVGIPTPRKEFWLAQYLEELNIPFCMGVGGSFDVIAGNLKWAPKWMRKAGLEWFFRLIQEPRRMWKRYLITNTVFIYLVLKEIISEKHKALFPRS